MLLRDGNGIGAVRGTGDDWLTGARSYNRWWVGGHGVATRPVQRRVGDKTRVEGKCRWDGYGGVWGAPDLARATLNPVRRRCGLGRREESWRATDAGGAGGDEAGTGGSWPATSLW